MSTTESRLKRDLLADGVADPYNDDTCLQYYLQDFYATGETQENGNTDTATNGADEYAAKVSIEQFSDIMAAPTYERLYFALNNGERGFSTSGPTSNFPDADSVVIGVFQDEADGMSGFIDSDVLNLANSITNLDSTVGGGFYRGLFFPVETATGLTPLANEYNSHLIIFMLWA